MIIQLEHIAIINCWSVQSSDCSEIEATGLFDSVSTSYSASFDYPDHSRIVVSDDDRSFVSRRSLPSEIPSRSNGLRDANPSFPWLAERDLSYDWRTTSLFQIYGRPNRSNFVAGEPGISAGARNQSSEVGNS